MPIYTGVHHWPLDFVPLITMTSSCQHYFKNCNFVILTTQGRSDLYFSFCEIRTLGMGSRKWGILKIKWYAIQNYLYFRIINTLMFIVLN